MQSSWRRGFRLDRGTAGLSPRILLVAIVRLLLCSILTALGLVGIALSALIMCATIAKLFVSPLVGFATRTRQK